ncbi:YihY/virulence factor BrkB family protein [Jiella marina]|uniref:YihY/virulence factor BrkB family protein n=1 Tax=Jiella sp. LLJ827 TaxID=2917712 RepID=UPI0021016DE2|nr:YihY/virulence factor BrkB family protein [Jiella sp. LLJ827]MCQ0988018.1 YihY/virulence factor BrkB family protein [Jiella sp. LLJ827]
MSQEATYRPDHGHRAETPMEMPKKGWKDVLFRVKDQFETHSVTLVAGGLTFYLLLSLFPAIASLVAIYGLLADPQTIQQQVSTLQGIVPEGALSVIQSQLERLSGKADSSLSIAFAISLLLSLWSANKGVTALFKAMNIAYEEEDERGMVKRTAMTLGFTLATILLVVAALAVVVVLPAALSVLPLGGIAGWLVAAASAVVLAGVALLWIGGLFRFGPDRRHARFKWLTPGAIVTIVGWIVASLLFGFYTGNVKNFDASYGSFASIIVFLMWTWIMMIVLLVGAEINAQLEHQTRRDTTVGPEREPGDRQAKLADQIVALREGERGRA